MTFIIMKNIIIAILALIGVSATAQPYYYTFQDATHEYVYTNVYIYSTNTAIVGAVTNANFTNVINVPNAELNTFQIYYWPAGTNTSQIFIDRNIDGTLTNWFTVWSNTFTFQTNSEYVSAIGKWGNYRVRGAMQGTNLNAYFEYIGQ